MDIYYKTKQLEKTFNKSENLQKEYGQSADKIKQRLSELAAINNLSEIFKHPSARCHELKGEYKGKFAVDLKHPYRLIFEPYHDPIPTKDDGGIDLVKITTIRILKIEDYH